jgi:HD superfamily phosphohydrolase
MGYTADCVSALLLDPNVRCSLDEKSILAVLAAGLLHDVGHYPFAHSLEAVHRGKRDTPRHEELGRHIVLNELGPTIKDSLGVAPERVANLFSASSTQLKGPDAFLSSIISGAIDADKMDYLERDSAHLGVPYGRSFDIGRLIAALRLAEHGDKIAIDIKGKLPAEMFIFSRYMMFSEVYWHHTVRAASAMVEAALADYMETRAPSLEHLKRLLLGHGDDDLLSSIAKLSGTDSRAQTLISRLVAPNRQLFKRIVTYSRSYAEDWKRSAYEILYQADTDTLLRIRDACAVAISNVIGGIVHRDDLLIDTPPRDKDHHESIAIQFSNVLGCSSYPLHELSQIVSGVHDDFVAVVKKIRIFASPEVAAKIRQAQHRVELELAEAILGNP